VQDARHYNMQGGVMTGGGGGFVFIFLHNYHSYDKFFDRI
jgi:hypothetical protein